MFVGYFAHNGIDHATQAETVVHEGSDSTLWILAGSVIMAAILYTVIRTLNRRQTQEETEQEDQEL